MLCESCSDYRFPTQSASESAKSRRKPSAVKKSASVLPSVTDPGPSHADPVAAGIGKDVPVDAIGVTESDSYVTTDAKLIANELLSYACYHRNGCRQHALVSVICGFIPLQKLWLPRDV